MGVLRSRKVRRRSCTWWIRTLTVWSRGGPPLRSRVSRASTLVASSSTRLATSTFCVAWKWAWACRVARRRTLASERPRSDRRAWAGGSSTCEVFVSRGLGTLVGEWVYHVRRQMGHVFLLGRVLSSQASRQWRPKTCSHSVLLVTLTGWCDLLSYLARHMQHKS